MLKIKNKIRFTSLCLFVLMLASYTGCKEDNGVGSTYEPDRRFNNLSVGFFSDITSKDNTIIITEAKFVLRQMNIKVTYDETLYDIRMEPFVVNLDVNGRVITCAIASLPPGNYHRIKFQLHKPTPNDFIPDPDFTESNNRRFSVVVKGYFNGVPFVYKSSTTAARGIDIENSPIIITVGGTVNLTVSLDPYSWFDDNGILNPNDEQNRHIIDHNIQESFKRVFRDMNMDGQPD